MIWVISSKLLARRVKMSPPLFWLLISVSAFGTGIGIVWSVRWLRRLQIEGARIRIWLLAICCLYLGMFGLLVMAVFRTFPISMYIWIGFASVAFVGAGSIALARFARPDRV